MNGKRPDFLNNQRMLICPFRFEGQTDEWWENWRTLSFCDVDNTPDCESIDKHLTRVYSHEGSCHRHHFNQAVTHEWNHLRSTFKLSSSRLCTTRESWILPDCKLSLVELRTWRTFQNFNFLACLDQGRWNSVQLNVIKWKLLGILLMVHALDI